MSIVKTIVLGTLQIDTVIVKQKNPLFTKNNTFSDINLIGNCLDYLYILHYPNILNILYSTWIIEV